MVGNPYIGSPAPPIYRSQRGRVIYFLEFWDPLHISGTVEAIETSKFGKQIEHEKH